ncbi:MAG: tRNA (cytidine(34)-2'-O)-methyltransferase [Deltaproteobacteria bacterium]
MHIVLVEPEIPQNTGNIARTCVLTGTTLHLVGRLGFSLEDRYLKRAGLDYWDKLEMHRWNSLSELFEAYPDNRFYLASTHAKTLFNNVRYTIDDMLIFGSESCGLGPDILSRYPDHLIRIPMKDYGRSLNLSNSAAVILFEAMRQLEYPGMV